MLNECFRLVNKAAFANQLPEDMKLVWSNRLTSTAGFCRYQKLSDGSRKCEIHLSSKVCDSPGKLILKY